MGGTSTEKRTPKVEIDSRVGGLVWVRRRNGTWWPGQIVDSEEASESSLISPRSGTPIKLLCRDDASVDWYNLDKSPRVKAFRCGEYDACIEKAMAIVANNSSRKCTQRNNAILRALELERASLSKDSARDSILLSSRETSPEETSACEEDSKSIPGFSHSGLSYETTNGFSSLKELTLKTRRRKTPNDSEDDGSEGIKRMRGLDDLGMVSARKILVCALPDTAPRSSVSLNNYRAVNYMSVGSLSNGGSTPPSKRKRSQVVRVNECLKRKHRRCPVTKVLENSTTVSVPVIVDEFVSPFQLKDAETSSSLKFFEDDPSDNLFDVPFIDEEAHLDGFTSISRSSASALNECRNESGSTSSASAHINDNVGLKTEKGTSKWKSKRNRKSRHLSVSEELGAEKITDPDDELASPKHVDRFSPGSSVLINGFRDRSKPVSPRDSRSYHRSHFLVHPRFETPDLFLYEVDIEVQNGRSCRPQHVPYISLMSKLNGKAITGHPVTVEVLEDGNCDLEFNISDHFTPDEDRKKISLVSKSLKKHLKSKKTRKLSSLTGSDNAAMEVSKPLVSNLNPALACIPLKVVFSRINEALNGSSRLAHRVLTPNST